MGTLISVLEQLVFICSYVLVCISLYVLWENWRTRKVSSEAMILILDEQYARFVQEKSINKKMIKKVIKRLHNEKVKIDIYHFLITKSIANPPLIKAFLEQTQLFQKILERKKLGLFDNLYKVKLIGAFKLRGYSDFLLQQCMSSTVYLQQSALKSISEFGEASLLLEAVSSISEDQSDIHNKLLIESLQRFPGNCIELQEKIIENFPYFSARMKFIIIQYLQINNNEIINEFFYDLFLTEDNDIEVIIACLKYFSRVRDDRIKVKVVHLLENEHWEVRLFSILVLKNYHDINRKKYLEWMTKDSDFMVRKMAVSVIYELYPNDNIIKEILNSPDNYAADSMASLLSEYGELLTYMPIIKDSQRREYMMKILEKKEGGE